MSLHINSEMHSNGSKYNGVWEFPTKFKGVYKVLDQYVEQKPIPWIVHENNYNDINMTVDDVSYSFLLFAPDDFDTYAVNEDLNDIKNYIQVRFNAIFVLLGKSITVAVTLNTDNETYTLQFSQPILMEYSDMTNRTIFETGNNDIFGSTFIWSTKNITTTPVLMAKIPECVNYIQEPDVDGAAIIMHTTGNPLINMVVSFPFYINELNITIYRQSIPLRTVDSTNCWDLILGIVSP